MGQQLTDSLQRQWQLEQQMCIRDSYSMTRKKVSPEINALSAIIFCVILAIILISNAMDSRAYRRNQNAIRKAMQDEGGR